MITLSDMFRVGDYTIYRDVVYQDATRRYTSAFYGIPDAPRLARDDVGGPAFDFLWYRRPLNVTGARAGALVTLTTEMTPTSDELAQLIAGVRNTLSPESLGTISIMSLPIKDGTVTLSVGGEASGGDGTFTAQIAGSGPARLSGSERATFAVDLTADGAALLYQAIDAGLRILHVRYDLVFDCRLDDTKLHVWCDARRAYDLAAGMVAGSSVTPQQLVESLTAQRVAGVEVTSASALAADQRAALERIGLQLLTTALSSSFFDSSLAGGTAGGTVVAGQVGGLRPFDAMSEATLNHTFTESFPVEQHAVRDVLLSLGSRSTLGNRIRVIDLQDGFFRVLEVKIYCTIDFVQSPVAAIVVRLAYDATGPSGRVAHNDDFHFQDGAPTVRTFRTNTAAPDARSYRYSAEVRYRSPTAPSATFDYGQADATVIVVDPRIAGVLRVTFDLGEAPLDVIRAAVVDVEYGSPAATTRLILDGSTPSTVWQAQLTDSSATTYRYHVTWVTIDNQRLETTWQPSSSHAILLNAPQELVRRGEVQLMAAGDFSAVSQIVVALKAAPEADPTEFTFKRAGETQTWRSSALDAAALHYRARRTFLYVDGSVRQLDWTEETRPVLVVRDELRVDIQIVPRLLDFQTTWNLAIVALTYDDTAAGVHQRQTLVLHDSSEARWSFHVGSPTRPTFEYELTLIPKQGPRVVLPRQASTAEILVLQPPHE